MRISPVVQSLTEPLLSPLVSAITGVIGGGFNPRNLFAANEPGYLYDLDDLSTVFLDSAMTTPATVNGLVGAVMDKSPNAKHATQTTTGSKPVLRGTPTGANLVTNGDFASDTWWGKDPGISIAGGKAVFTSATNYFTLYTPALTISAPNVYRIRFTIDSISSGGIRVDVGSAVSATYTSAGTYEVYLTATGVGTQMSFRAIGTTTATIDNVSLHDVSAGSVTAPYALQYDGVDDFLQTAAVDFTATDKVTVCHGVRKLSDAGSAVVVELTTSADGNFSSFYIVAPYGANPTFGFQSRGTGSAGSAFASGSPSPSLAVITGIGEIATDTSVLRKNGIQVASSAVDQGTGNYANAALYFGRRGGTSLPYNGLEFSSICIGRLLTAAELANAERWVARKTGLTL